MVNREISLSWKRSSARGIIIDKKETTFEWTETFITRWIGKYACIHVVLNKGEICFQKSMKIYIFSFCLEMMLYKINWKHTLELKKSFKKISINVHNNYTGEIQCLLFEQLRGSIPREVPSRSSQLFQASRYTQFLPYLHNGCTT